MMHPSPTTRLPATRAEISRSRLVGNFERLRSLAWNSSAENDCDLLAVVKADAYGHDLSLCAPWLVDAGARWIGVTTVQEGVQARLLSPGVQILVMRGLLPGEAEPLLEAHLVPTVWNRQHLELLAAAATQRNVADGSVPVHLEIDTGMTRQGVSWSTPELVDMLNGLREVSALHLGGVFTHFASPEILDGEQNQRQMERFVEAAQQIFAAGFRPRWLHAGNSSTLLAQHQLKPLVALAKKIQATLLLRAGLALYGYALPFVRDGDATAQMPIDLQPVLSWKTAIASLRTVAAGTTIGYNATFVAPSQMQLALLPVGYADGLNRKLSGGKSSNGGHVLVRGVAAPIVGRISMDLTVIDVSHVAHAAIGDEVILLGEQNGERITADDHARWAETIPYEILCAISARVPRMECERG